MHFAIENDYPEIVVYILKLTKNLLRNKVGKTPVDVCRSDKLKEQLLKCGIIQKKGTISPDKSRLSQAPREEGTVRDNRIEKVPLSLISQETLSPSSFTYFKVLGKGSFGEVFLVQKKG